MRAAVARAILLALLGLVACVLALASSPRAPARRLGGARRGIVFFAAMRSAVRVQQAVSEKYWS